MGILDIAYKEYCEINDSVPYKGVLTGDILSVVNDCVFKVGQTIESEDGKIYLIDSIESQGTPHICIKQFKVKEME